MGVTHVTLPASRRRPAWRPGEKGGPRGSSALSRRPRRWSVTARRRSPDHETALQALRARRGPRRAPPPLAAACGDTPASPDLQVAVASSELLTIFRLTIEDEWRAEAMDLRRSAALRQRESRVPGRVVGE